MKAAAWRRVVGMVGGAEAGGNERRCYWLPWQSLACLECSCVPSFPVSYLGIPCGAEMSHLIGHDFLICLSKRLQSLIFKITHFSSVLLALLRPQQNFLGKMILRKFITYIARWLIFLFNWNGFHMLSLPQHPLLVYCHFQKQFRRPNLYIPVWLGMWLQTCFP